MGLAPAPALAAGMGPSTRPAHGTSPSTLPPATPQSQYHGAHLLDQLKSPGGSAASPAATTPPSPAGMPRAQQQAPLAGASSASATPVNVSTWSYEQWTEWRSRWNTHQLMYWQFYGIRRTRQEQQTRQRVLQMQSAEGAEGEDADADALPLADGVDGAELELSQAEQEDLLLSPHCRTFFNAAHFHLYPLRLANVAGVTLSFDDDPTVFDLHIGEKYNTENPDGVTGREMWEAIW